MQELKINITVNTAEAKAKLRLLEKQLESITNKRYTLKIDTTNALNSLNLIRERLRELNTTHRIRLDTSILTRNVQQLTRELRTLTEEIRRLNNSNLNNLNNSFNGLSQRANIMGLEISQLTTALKTVVGVSADFEESQSKLQAVLTLTKNEMGAFEQKARELGATTAFSATQVTEGMLELAKAGLSQSEVLASIEATLTMASAGGISLAKASDLASNALSQFGLEADEAVRVVDTFAKTTTMSNTNMTELGWALRNVGAVAKTAGLSIEDTSAYLGVLADNGRKGGDAGTHLKIILNRLTAQASTTKKAMNALNIEVFNTDGSMKDMTAILSELSVKLKDVDDKSKMEYFKAIAGSEAIASFQVLMDSMDSIAEKQQKLIDKDGTAKEMAVVMMDNLKGAWKELKSALEEMYISMTDELIPALTDMVDSVRDGVVNLTEFYNVNKEVINGLVKTVAELSAVAIGIYATAKAFNALRIASLFLIANPIGAIITGIGVAVAGVVTAFNYFEAKEKEVENVNNALLESLDKTSTALKGYETALKSQSGIAEYTQKVGELIDEKIKLKKYFESKDPQKFGKEISTLAVEIDSLTLFTRDLGEEYNKLETSTKAATEKKRDLTEATKDMTAAEKNFFTAVYTGHAETLKGVLSGYDNRIEKSATTLGKLEAQEQNLVDKLKAQREKLQTDLQKIDNEYILKQQDLKNTLLDIQSQLFGDKKAKAAEEQRLEEQLALAKGAIRDGNLQLSKQLLTNYENSLKSSLLTEAQEHTKLKEKKEKLLTELEATQQAKMKALSNATGADREANYAKYKEYQQKEKALKEEINAIKIQSDNKVSTNAKTKLNELDGAYKAYFTAQKAEITAKAQLEIEKTLAQLNATKLQIEAQKTLIDLTKQLIEALTGKKADIDTSEFSRKITELNTQTEELERKLKNKTVVDVDVENAKQSLETLNLNSAINIRADIAEFEQKTAQIQEKMELMNTQEVILTANTDLMEEKLFSIEKEMSNLEQWKIDFLIEGSEAEIAAVETDLRRLEKERQVLIKVLEEKGSFNEVNKLLSGIEDTKQVDVDTEVAEADIKFTSELTNGLEDSKSLTVDTTEATQNINKVQEVAEQDTSSIHKIDVNNAQYTEVDKPFNETPTDSLHTINSEASAVYSTIADISRNTSSTHTIFVKTVETHAVGGMAGFTRRRGKISGYDPFGKDDVPAMLTKGEYIIKADTVKKLGVGFLNDLNRLNLDRLSIPKFNTGGYVEQLGAATTTVKGANLGTYSLNFNLPHGQNATLKGDAEPVEIITNYFKKFGV
jgi:TP901 family phage tail tape measure protein